MKFTKLLEWLLWTDYLFFGISKSRVFIKSARQYKCEVCGNKFWSRKEYPVCFKFGCWNKYKGW